MSTGYLKDGRMVEVHSKIDGGFIVEHYEHYQDWEGEYQDALSGNRVVVSDVLKTPPEQKFCESINSANDQLASIRGEISKKRAELNGIKEDADIAIKRTKSIPAIKNILDFIDGKYKYFAFPCAYEEKYLISGTNTALDDNYDRYERNTKLLTLSGNSKGDLQWNTNRYSDGSGSSKVCVPCMTIEDANEVISNHFYAELEKSKDGGNKFYVTMQVNWLIKNKYKCDKMFIEMSNQYEKDKKANAIKSAEDQLKRAVEALKKAKGD